MDYIYPEIIRGIEDTLFESGYSLVLANCNQDYSRELSSLQRLIDQGIKGLILEPSRNFLIDREHPITKMLENLQIPIVATHWGRNNAKLSTVTINDELAGYEAIRHFLKKGHKKDRYCIQGRCSGRLPPVQGILPRHGGSRTAPGYRPDDLL